MKNIKCDHFYYLANTEFVHSHTNSNVWYPKPKKGEIELQREIKLSLYLNYDEWKMLKIKAEKVGYNKSALVRSLIEGFETKESSPREFYEELNSIRKVGNVLNQIARRTHYQGYIEYKKI